MLREMSISRVAIRKMETYRLAGRSAAMTLSVIILHQSEVAPSLALAALSVSAKPNKLRVVKERLPKPIR